jgi:hypothetical protein
MILDHQLQVARLHLCMIYKTEFKLEMWHEPAHGSHVLRIKFKNSDKQPVHIDVEFFGEMPNAKTMITDETHARIALLR